ncbi:MAG TPA: nuclear transport factor 2 family protein [Terracidiphilus sp.]|nr:nuclear transport factor 2 family protein [Terracidiphilus sp.]
MRSSLLCVAALTALAVSVHAQTNQGLPPADDLYKTVSGLDTALFSAYNTCNLGKLGSMVTEDLEFYHDQTGLSVGRKPFLEAIKANICGKVHRELVPGSLEVYPLKGYGAVEIGVHRFTHPNDPTALGEAKFVHVWQLKDGVWKVARVISFDHHPVN